ncbi:uncharacterized protein LOC130770446 [Actinidia eriantha]|uniref:uncharacterized protein LOC130770446 n=1 Tax=Actinidia eriantha TaxID=165200 RepID=UPI0025891118|nr:uncharacterized protein LOC130770446 [Actinidia eriantha]
MRFQKHSLNYFPKMNSTIFSLFSLFFLCTHIVSSSPNKIIPRLSPLLGTILRDEAHDTIPASIPVELKTYFYTQTLDHFNYKPESYATFQQRYVVNSKYWGGANTSAPILAYLGAEAPLDGDLTGVGFLTDNAPRLNALMVYIEHRFYGQSVPFGKLEDVLKNDSVRGYFNSAQAIADYAEVLLYLKRNLSAQHSPIIVIGGSYGGMLAAWFRLKYPHIALGALSSSAPILYFDDITPQNGYYSIVTKDFKEASESCAETIRESWSQIDELVSKTSGLSILSQKFKTCKELNKSSELKNYLEYIYDVVAQYNHPPTYPVNVVCGGIDGAPKGSDVLSRVFAGVVAYKGNKTCYDTNEYNYPSSTNLGFSWQTCSEIVLPIGRGINETMFPPAPFDLNSFTEDCRRAYGVSPRPHWVTTYYGGHDIKMVLHRFASNIIFSNGLKDPYSSGGVLEDISDSVLAVSTVNGSHCLDILPAKQSDPQWLIMQRKREVEIMEGWINNYNADLLVFKQ